ncbi:MAG: hypothetical protein RBU29_09855, partial [bacterium]|nr:hypothetical protein [bacterium]
MNYIQTMKKGIKMMKKILLFPFSVFFYLLCGSAIGFSDIDQITIQKIFQDAFHAYASEFDVYKPEEFSEGFVSKLNEWGDRQSIVDIKKNKNSIINFSLRNLYTDGAYVDRIMGELLALEYVYKTTQRKRIGLPVYTMEESETARKMLEEFKLKYTNMLENKIDRFLDGMGKSEDPNMKELK